MSPEEQLIVVTALEETLADTSSDVRKQALHCLVALGLDGLGRIIDAIDDAKTLPACRLEAVQALGSAFSEGKVDKKAVVRMAIKALEDCLTREDDTLVEAAVDALGDIGTEAISAKPKLLALMDGKRNHHRIRVKCAAALLNISPVH